MTETPTEFDIHAYIDGELDVADRFAVEAHLAEHPERAARVMSELCARTGLRLLTRGAAAPCPRLIAQSEALARRRPTRLWRSAIPAGALSIAVACTGLWFWTARPPAYVDAALASHRIALMRANMASQLETPELNVREILANTRIRLPALPADWRITDVQLFPGNGEPALLIAARTGTGERLTLFAIRKRSGAPDVPDTVQEDGHSVAYWRNGEMSYALVGEEDPRRLDRVAEGLDRS